MPISSREKFSLLAPRPAHRENTFQDLLRNARALTPVGYGNSVLTGASLAPGRLSSSPNWLPSQKNRPTGGPTLTHSLARPNPAIDKGNHVLALATDQRGAGFARVIGAAPDNGIRIAERNR